MLKFGRRYVVVRPLRARRTPDTGAPAHNLPPNGFTLGVLIADAAQSTATSDSKTLILPVADGFRGDASGLLWTIILVGFATAALVQFGKDFFSWRSNFQRHRVHDWIERRWGQVTPAVVAALWEGNPTASDRKAIPEAIRQLETLASADRVESVRTFSYTLAAYSLPAEELLGQLASVAEVVVSAPDQFPELFGVFSGGEGDRIQSDVRLYVKACRARREPEPVNKSSTGSDRTVEHGVTPNTPAGWQTKGAPEVPPEDSLAEERYGD